MREATLMRLSVRQKKRKESEEEGAKKEPIRELRKRIRNNDNEAEKRIKEIHKINGKYGGKK